MGGSEDGDRREREYRNSENITKYKGRERERERERSEERMIEYDEGRRWRKTELRELREKRAACEGRQGKKRRQGKKGGRWIDDTEKMDRKNGRRRKRVSAERVSLYAHVCVAGAYGKYTTRPPPAVYVLCRCASIPSLLLAHFPPPPLSLSRSVSRGFSLALV